MSFSAFASGFVGAAVDQQNENRQLREAWREKMFDHYATNVIPYFQQQKQAATVAKMRAKHYAFLLGDENLANELAANGYTPDQVMEFKDKYTVQRAASTTPAGPVDVDTVQTVLDQTDDVTDTRPMASDFMGQTDFTWWDKMMGKPNYQQIEMEIANQMAAPYGMTGAQLVSFDPMKEMPRGDLSGMSITENPKALAEEFLTTFDPADFHDYNAAMQAYMSGDWQTVADQAVNFDTRQAAEIALRSMSGGSDEENFKGFHFSTTNSLAAGYFPDGEVIQGPDGSLSYRFKNEADAEAHNTLVSSALQIQQASGFKIDPATAIEMVRNPDKYRESLEHLGMDVRQEPIEEPAQGGAGEATEETETDVEPQVQELSETELDQMAREWDTKSDAMKRDVLESMTIAEKRRFTQLRDKYIQQSQ